MAYNTTTGANVNPVAVDRISGADYQATKVFDGGADGLTPARVRDTTPMTNDGGLVTRQAPIKIWSTSFASVGSGLQAPEMTQRAAGTGVTVSQASSALLVAMGTSARQEFLARSLISFAGAAIFRYRIALSQRIANNNFMAMLADRVGESLSATINSATSVTVTRVGHGLTSANVGQFMNIGAIVGATGVPGRYAIAAVPTADTIDFTVAGWPASGSATVDLFGHNFVRVVYSGTGATSATADAQRFGWASGDTTITTTSTASAGHVMQIQIDGRNVYWGDFPPASTTTPPITARASRFENIPDDSAELFVYLWAFNGTTAPASSTTMTLGFLSVEDLTNNGVYIAGVRQLGTASAIPVAFPSAQSVTVSGSVSLTAGTTAVGSFAPLPTTAGGSGGFRRIATADNNLASIKTSVGILTSCVVQNLSATTFFFKLYNKNSAPNLATDTPVHTYAVQPNSSLPIDVGPAGERFALGIAIALSRDLADTGTTALAANDGIVNATFI